MRILIAEDQQMARVVLATHLRKWGHKVTEVRNGKDALTHILRAQNEVDLLITDWSMPLMDGVELAQKVRELTASSNYIYIILLTSRGDAADLVQGFTEGQVDDYIVKPFEAMELQLRVQVASRLIGAERKLREYTANLENIVYTQTEAIRETHAETINRLFTALESRDQETALHVRRIGSMSACMSRLLGWTERQIGAIQAAAPLHDIGKIGISDAVLLKEGPLDWEEFQEIKSHTVIGAKILSGSQNPVLQMGETIALYHHENWDGSGYPNGLKTDEIPLEAQIVSITDAYDALLSDRIYRKGLPENEVLRFIIEQRGKKFSPALVNLFLDNIKEIKMQCSIEEKKLFPSVAAMVAGQPSNQVRGTKAGQTPGQGGSNKAQMSSW